MSETEQIDFILKQVSYERVEETDGGRAYCVFCPGEEPANPTKHPGEVIIHDAACSTAIARTVLRTRGTPIGVYKVTFERQVGNQTWMQRTEYCQGFSIEEVQGSYEGYKNLRDIHAEFISAL